MSKFTKTIEEIKYEFFNIVIREILVSLDNFQFMPATLLSFCCIEYLSSSLGNNDSDLHFEQFFEKYMPDLNSMYKRKETQEFLLSVKQSLLLPNNFLQIDSAPFRIPRFEIYTRSLHLAELEDLEDTDETTFCIIEFISDVIVGTEIFFSETKDINLFNAWYQKLFVGSGIGDGFYNDHFERNKKRTYSQIHPSLKSLDNGKKSPAEMKNQILTSILKRQGLLILL